MTTLFVNGCFREGSRTLQLAEKYLEGSQGPVERVELGELHLPVLDKANTAKYCEAVAKHDFSDSMFDYGKQFAQAEEIVIAAPFWNYSVPAQLHVYLELVCSQGVTFDINAEGRYGSLCKAKKLTFITTAGGYIPEQDHAWSYIKDLAEVFWDIKELHYYKAEGLDIIGTDVKAVLAEALK